MIITPISLPQFGMQLPAAAIEIEEVTARRDTTFEDNLIPRIPKDSLVKIKVWVNEDAYRNDLHPIHVFERPMMLDLKARDEFFTSILNEFALSQQ
jgi:hypothetical protein